MSSLVVFIASILFYCWYYIVHYGKKPEIYGMPASKFSIFLNKHVSSITKRYWSLFWSPGGRLQTILAALLPCMRRKIYYKTESVDTPDGGQFVMAWASKFNKHVDTQPLVVIFPGLVSHSTSNYILLMVHELTEKGFCAVVMVNRGVEIPCKTPTYFCATFTNDMELAIKTIKQRYPNRPLVAAGVSFGGLLLSRYLALKGADSMLQAAYVYACPFSPVECSISMEKWDHWILFNFFVTLGLLEVYKKSKERFNGAVDHHKMRRVSSVREFDSEMTAKVFGYETVDHYYRDGVITSKFLQSIRTPTLCLCADDDMFVPLKSIPAEEISHTDYVTMAITHGGGHVGHLQGLNPFGTPYFIDVMTDYLTAAVTNLDELPVP